MKSETVEVARRVDPAGWQMEWPALRVEELFEQNAARHPEAPAIVTGDDAISYGELNERANAVARELVRRGVGREEAVGVLMERSAWLPAAFLGILKAGAAYVPMGADLPPKRLANMAAQAEMRLVVALDGLEPPAELDGLAVLRPETLERGGEPVKRGGGPRELAAILFTSGSTGQPKGVLLEHAASVNMACGHIRAHGIGPEDRVLLATAPGFILGYRELCLPLVAGAAFVPVSRQQLDDPAGLVALMAERRVTVAMFTPSYLHLFHGAAPEGLRCILTAGERPNADDARHYAGRLDYWNIHGATEVCGTICMLRVEPAGEGPLASGRPFANTAVYLLDSAGREVEPGEVGEIHVVGAGVARGYLGQPGLTAERFVETRWGRAYRTNDLGRWNGDGLLETLGRANDVVKVSGQAVSLGEIEQTLLRHERVRYAAALQRDGRLTAFVEMDGAAELPQEHWHRYLGQTLARYMLPSRVTAVARIPLNAYGKVDRQALLDLEPEEAREGAGPEGRLENEIAAVWERVLGVHPVARDTEFFALGGTSLQSIEIAQQLAALGYAVSARTVLASSTVAALAGQVEPAAEAGAEEETEGAATAGQEDFWIAAKLGRETAAAQITRVLAVRGQSTNAGEVQSAWSRLVARHAALRTEFFEDASGEVRWRTRERVATTVTVDACATLVAAREVIETRADAALGMGEAPLARAGLIRVEESGETLVWFTLHHAVVDGLSARVVEEDLHALLAGGEPGPAKNGTARASRAEREYLGSAAAARDAAYWQERLGELPAAAFHEFATDWRRPASPSGRPSAPLTERLDAATVAALGRLAQEQRVGFHALMTALVGVEARRRDGRREMLVGTAISARPAGAEGAVGYFVNLLPLALTETGTFARQMKAAQAELTGAVEHGRYPAGLLYREFRERHPHARPYGRTSLFDISMTANPSRICGEAGGLRLEPRALPGREVVPAGIDDLAFSHEPVEDGVELALHWNPDVYSRETAAAWLGSVAGWARWLAGDRRRAEEALPALLPEEAARLAEWETGPTVERPRGRFHEVVEEVAARMPAHPAVVSETGTQSYGELEGRANAVARTLVEAGVRRGEPVAVLTDPSAALPAVVLGIWKAGAVYVPLAVEYPAARLAYMAGDAGARVLVVLDGHAVPVSLAEAVGTILRPEAFSQDERRVAVAGAPEDAAYVIYTSGTTGMPKGVVVRHDGLVNVAFCSRESFGLTVEDRFSLVATPGFDASLWEMSSALANGMALVPVSKALRDDPWALKRWYRRFGVTVAFHAPSYLRVSRQTPFEGLRVLVTGGEAPTHEDARWHAGNSELFNAYGPTETSIYVCAERVWPEFDTSRPLPVGRPMANTRLSIRRANGERVAPGVTGELWIGGVGVSEGYRNNAALTAERFVEQEDGRWYRSGDLARWTGEGLVELAGRIDHQVKLHGQRLELGEIEEALRGHPAVAEAAVVAGASANGTQALWGFVRLRAGVAEPGDGDWQAHLGERLPRYMIPAAVIRMEAIPLIASGKVDREALLERARQQGTGSARTAPRGELETAIGRAWSELLGVEVAREDNFFALGGNSLLAVTLAHRLSEELGRTVAARTLFAAPTLAGFAESVAVLPEASGETAGQCDLATEGQREFWVAEAAGLDTRVFTIPVLRRVAGEMPPVDQWQAAWRTVVARHDALRTRFHEDSAGRVRRVVDECAATLEVAEQADPEAAVGHIRQRQNESLSMSEGPMWRAGLVHVAGTGEHLFWMSLHHAVADGRSLEIVFEEMAGLLGGAELEEAPDGVGETAAREQSYLSSPAAEEDGRYWRELLAAQPDAAFAEAPLDFPQARDTEDGTHRLELRLEAETAQGLRAVARRHATSLHAVILTLLAVEARRRTGREELIIGTAASLRETVREQQAIGYFINMLPVPFRMREGASFGQVLDGARQTLAEGLLHARYPFSRMYHEFWRSRTVERHPTRYPLFDLAVSENPARPPAPAALRLERLESGDTYERTETPPGEDMVLIHEDLADGGMVLLWLVDAALYSEETARRWLEALGGWARWLTAEAERAEQPLPALLEAEAAELARLEPGEARERPGLRMEELFEQVVDEPGQAERPAVVTAEGVIRYGELEREANRIAAALGARPGVVAVLTGRSASLPAAVLGIWKAGGTYLPLASDLPRERVLYMAADAGAARLVVLDGLTAPEGLALPALRPEELTGGAERPARTERGAEAAYILYTSGSTGRPKGTLIGHGAYVNTVLGAGEMLGVTREERSLLFASPSFDVSLSDIGMPLVFGASVCPVPYDVLSAPKRFLEFLRAMEVTLADITPTYLRLFDGAALGQVRTLVTGGEAPIAADVEAYAGRLRYFNAYGPTENAITSTMGRLRPGAVSCGRPLANTRVRICDGSGRAVAPGVAGEVWLGGAGLAEGYLNRPELTAAAFVQTRDGRWYRTGDLGRWRADGSVEILGRADDQVKLNGIRVELGEIEHALASHEAVGQAAVVVVDGGPGERRRLSGFVRLKPGAAEPEAEAWREFLAARLPSYMIPAVVTRVDAIPVNRSGKVDRAALRALAAGEELASGTAPEPGLETIIAQVWSQVLNVVQIHREDNFFAMGGHSLLAIRVAHRLEKLLGHPVPARELFGEPTLAGFARRLAQTERLAEDVAPSDRATVGQCEFRVAEEAGLDTRGFNMPMILAVKGEAPADEQWRAAWGSMVKRHEALRTTFALDGAGVLRRVVLEESAGELEMARAQDLERARAHILRRQVEPFSMAVAPLWRAGVMRVEETGQTLFWMVLHHAVGDGESLAVLREEMEALLEGCAPAAVEGTFSQSAGREERYLAGPACREDARYWSETLGALDEAFEEWPLDGPRPVARTAANAKGAHCFRLRLEAETAAGLGEVARRHGTSLHVVMLTLMAREIGRRTGRREMVLGTPASTRDAAGEARVVGFYVNMLPLVCRVGGSFEEDLARTRQALGEGMRHVRYPFARISEEFRAARNLAVHPARYPLYDFVVNEDPSAAGGSRGLLAPLSGLVEGYELRPVGIAQDMVLVHAGQADGGLGLLWSVNAAVYERETAAAWIESLMGWARLVARGVTPLPELLPEEAERLAGLEEGERLVAATALHRRFEELAAEAPERPALITDEGVASYAAVDARANALARALLDAGVGREEVVGVYTGRSATLPWVVLAIWKAGGCYLPLLRDLPEERVRFIAREAGVRVVVALDGAVPPVGERVLRPEEIGRQAGPVRPGGAEIGGRQLAAILYTSGSTGEPKGVMLHHEGLANLGAGMAAKLELEPGDRVSQMSSPAFDAWISDLATAWSCGAALVPVTRQEVDDPAGLRAKFARLGVTASTMTPSYLRLFEQAEFPGLRVLMTVGEPPHAGDARHYAARLRFVNGYGPTENSVATSAGVVGPDARRMAAGRPLANTWVRILDEQGRRVPPGAVGQIWTGGAGVSLGYLNRPALTAGAFRRSEEGMLYATGDRGRWTAQGELEVLGRNDGQVKLRGQRVELGEIEHRLRAHPAVREGAAAVETREDGGQALWAFVSLHDGAEAPDEAGWRRYLAATLPAYMIPAAVVQVAALPLNRSGKTDRTALLAMAPARTGSEPEAGRTAPLDGRERAVARVWAEHLECGWVAREDNFFDLGGNSLRAIAVVNRLRREFRCNINDLYEHPRLADFAAVCCREPQQLRERIGAAREHWRAYRRGLEEYEREREAALAAARRMYAARFAQERAGSGRRTYARVLVTGATGYLGAYVLRELLSDGEREVVALVRGEAGRLDRVLAHYFGAEAGSELTGNARLRVVTGDLRDARLPAMEKLQAIFHCAANVRHFGHYREFHEDNVAATGRLLELARAQGAEFHLASTLSVCGRAPKEGFRLFTEFDRAPAADENYYVRSKQEAERLVEAARGEVANASIHRFGNLVFAAGGGGLQVNLRENAFFRQLAAFLALDVVPEDAHVWLTHIDTAARAMVRLAEDAGCRNTTHHIESARRDTLAEFAAGAARGAPFDQMLDRLERAMDEPAMEAALTETLENFGVYSGESPQARSRRLEIVSERTERRLAGLGVEWPAMPEAGRAEFLGAAARLFARAAGGSGPVVPEE